MAEQSVLFNGQTYRINFDENDGDSRGPGSNRSFFSDGKLHLDSSGFVLDPGSATGSMIYNFGQRRSSNLDELDKYRSSSVHFTYQSAALWWAQNAAIKFINMTADPVKITSVSVKACGCDSGGSGYYWWGGGYSWNSGCTSVPSNFSVYVSVYDPTKSEFTKSSVVPDNPYNCPPHFATSSEVLCAKSASGDPYAIPKFEGGNMDSPGSRSSSARFGRGNYSDPYKRFDTFRDFKIPDCPPIPVHGYAFIHLRMIFSSAYSDSTNVMFQFSMDSDESKFTIETARNPYIWRMCEDKKWHLTEPLYRMRSNSGSWEDPGDPS